MEQKPFFGEADYCTWLMDALREVPWAVPLLDSIGRQGIPYVRMCLACFYSSLASGSSGTTGFRPRGLLLSIYASTCRRVLTHRPPFLSACSLP